ncbi:hypothetical protein SSBR45R_30060 [Bradyrhizobium sp. SSBR45R]|nr:hypothetical protein SSBR45R_30060 [Bradyrhizobium sp. SSBR45R]
MGTARDGAVPAEMQVERAFAHPTNDGLSLAREQAPPVLAMTENAWLASHVAVACARDPAGVRG